MDVGHAQHAEADNTIQAMDFHFATIVMQEKRQQQIVMAVRLAQMDTLVLQEELVLLVVQELMKTD